MRCYILALLVGLAASERGNCADSAPQPTSQEKTAPPPHAMFDSPAILGPYFGVLGFGDRQNNYTTRALEGLTFDYFLTASADRSELGTGRAIYGLESGLFYSNVDNTSYALIVPILFKGTRQLAHAFWIDWMFGADLLYRSP